MIVFTPSQVGTEIDDRSRVFRLGITKPSSDRGQLNLAIPPWVGAWSTSERYRVNGHTARCTTYDPCMVWQCKLLSG